MTVEGWKVSFVPYYMRSRGEWGAPRPEEAIRFLERERFDGVEWMLGYHFNSVQELESVARKTRESGLEVSNIMCWQDLVTLDESERKTRAQALKMYLETSSKLSIPILNIFTGPVTWSTRSLKIGRDISEGRAWSLVFESLNEVVATAEKEHVTLTVEAVFGMLVHDYYTMRELLSYFDSKYLGVNLDPSHLVLYGNDPAWAVSRLGDRIKHVHVKDAAGRIGTLGEDFVFPFLGEGSVNWHDFFSALEKTGYSGYLSLEFESDSHLNNVCNGDWQLAARDSKARLSKLLSESRTTGRARLQD